MCALLADHGLGIFIQKIIDELMLAENTELLKANDDVI